MGPIGRIAGTYPPASPPPLPGIAPLPDAAGVALGQLSPVGTAQQPRNWLERSPKKVVRPSLERERAGAEEGADVDVTEMSSAGHGMGEAL